jgi:hypothetical protein
LRMTSKGSTKNSINKFTDGTPMGGRERAYWLICVLILAFLAFSRLQIHYEHINRATIMERPGICQKVNGIDKLEAEQLLLST